MLSDVMIDLETFGNRADAAIASIGAVFFDPSTGEIGKQLHIKIDADSACKFGRVTGSTIVWWMQQSDAARAALSSGRTQLPDALEQFDDFYSNNRKARIWGNGPTFDITIMEHAYWRAMGRAAPWDFWNVRCCRTIKDLGTAIGYELPKITGTAHDALVDALHQARWVSEIHRRLLSIKIPAATVAIHRPSVSFDDI